MLLDTDVELRPAADLAQQVLRAARGNASAPGSLHLGSRQGLLNQWNIYKDSLKRVASVLKDWDEGRLADDVGEELAKLEQLIGEDPRGSVALSSYGDRADKIATRIAHLRLAIARLDPMGTPVSLARGSRGTVLALVVRRRSEDALRSRLWGLVRRQIGGAGGVALSSETTLLGDFRYKSGVTGEDCRERRLSFSNERDRRRLLDERGQDLLPSPSSASPTTGCHYDIQYYFIPGAAARAASIDTDGGSLDVLMRLAWGLSTLVPRDPAARERICCFWMCAAPARAWIPHQEKEPGKLQIEEDDAAMDHLSQLVSDETLANCLIVHRLLVPDPSRGLARWFVPAWRIPYQHRQKAQSAEDCLWATAPFDGLPGEELPIDLASNPPSSRTEYWPSENGSPDAAPPPRSYRRGATRISPRRAVYCRLCCNGSRFHAYLTDYSAMGCRLLLPPHEALSAALKNSQGLSIELPAGVPWPWEQGKMTAARVIRVEKVRQGSASAALHNEQERPIVKAGDVELRLRFLWGVGNNQGEQASRG